jgi:uncharacterized membrane protein YjjP (DUF1212 family)
MKSLISMSLSEKLTVISLIVAAAGVVIQIISGHKYPTVPPVFFILLLPALLLLFIHKWWVSLVAVIAGVFLFIGLFGSGAYIRLYHPNTVGDTIGLWIQTLAVIIVIIFGIYTMVIKRQSKSNSSIAE